jgi:hypothetical protein
MRAPLCTSRAHLGPAAVTRNRLTVEELTKDTFDVRELNRAGLLTGDWITLRPSLRWPRIATMRLARYRILLELRNQSVPQGIRVSWTRCHFGGFRPWLHCPYCEQRVAQLFRGLAGYCCRACCGNPIYESQRRSRKARAYLQAYRIRQRLGGSRPVVDAIPPRPRGMGRKTYARLCARVERLERKLIDSLVLRYALRWIAPLVSY